MFISTYKLLENGIFIYHDNIIKWKHFLVIGIVCGEFTGHRWTPLAKASDAELWCFLRSALNKRLSE